MCKYKVAWFILGDKELSQYEGEKKIHPHCTPALEFHKDKIAGEEANQLMRNLA